MRVKFQISKIHFIALLLLAAILSGVFSFAFSAPAIVSSAEMVYCPLTKKLQPVSPSKNDSPPFSLNEICANESEKNNFALAVIKNASISFSINNQNEFESLAFNFWQNAKAAFDKLPNSPNLPEIFTAKNSFSAIGFGNKFDNKLVWKTTEKFVFELKPRPPTEQNSPAFYFEIAREFKRISHQITPRAPPVLV